MRSMRDTRTSKSPAWGLIGESGCGKTTTVKTIMRSHAEERCGSEAPELAPVAGSERAVACWRAGELVLRGI